MSGDLTGNGRYIRVGATGMARWLAGHIGHAGRVGPGAVSGPADRERWRYVMRATASWLSVAGGRVPFHKAPWRSYSGRIAMGRMAVVSVRVHGRHCAAL
jgi:hypothetical protein